MFVDNSGVISLVLNPVDHAANKHIRVYCHFSQELARLKFIARQRVASEDNVADVLTKALGCAETPVALLEGNNFDWNIL